jgi:hypothetical protein
MAVQAAVFRRAVAQIVGRVKAEFLADFDHRASSSEAIGY